MNNNAKFVLQLISEKGPIRCTEIARQLNIDYKKITSIVGGLRRSFRTGKIDTYIYLSPEGYSLQESKRAVVYETNLRLSQIINMGINSHFVRTRCKKIALPEFKKLSIVYKPKLLLFEQEMK